MSLPKEMFPVPGGAPVSQFWQKGLCTGAQPSHTPPSRGSLPHSCPQPSSQLGGPSGASLASSHPSGSWNLATLHAGSKSHGAVDPSPWNQAENALCLVTFPPWLPGPGPVLEMLNRPFVVRSKGHLREAPHCLEQAQAASCPSTRLPPARPRILQTAHLGQASLCPRLLLTVPFLKTPNHPPQAPGSRRPPCLTCAVLFAPLPCFLQPEGSGTKLGRVPPPVPQGGSGLAEGRASSIIAAWFPARLPWVRSSPGVFIGHRVAWRPGSPGTGLVRLHQTLAG